jgi:hypothetical protein
MARMWWTCCEAAEERRAVKRHRSHCTGVLVDVLSKRHIYCDPNAPFK